MEAETEITPTTRNRTKGAMPGPWFALVLYVLMALIFTWPLALNLSFRVIGDQQGDMWKHLWGFWWVNRTVITDGYFPLSTQLLDYPYGGSLFFIDPLGALMSIPFQVFFSPAVSYNLVALVNLVLSAFWGYTLAHRFTRDRAASLIAGAGFAFTSYILAYLTSGVSETFNTWGIPMFLYYFDRVFRRNGEKSVPIAAGSFFLATLGSWYYGITCVLLGGLLFIYRSMSLAACRYRDKRDEIPINKMTPMMEIVQREFPRKVNRQAKIIVKPPGAERKEPVNKKTKSDPIAGGALLIGIIALSAVNVYQAGKTPAVSTWAKVMVTAAMTAALAGLLMNFSRRLQWQRRQWFGSYLTRLSAFCIVAGMLVLPLFITFKATMNQPSGMVRRERSSEYVRYYLSEDFHNVSRLTDYLRPGKNRADRTYTVDRLTRSSYAGWILLILALTGLITARRRPWFWFFAGGAAFFTLLSLGPFLYLDRGVGLREPFFLYRWLYNCLPFFNQVSIPYRFNLPAMLCISITAAYGFSAICRRFLPASRNRAAVILCLAVMMEIILVSPGPYPVPLSGLKVPGAYRAMARNKAYYGVIDLPIQRGKGELSCGEYFYYQTIHHKAIPYTVEGTIPRYIYQNPFTLGLYRLERGIPFPNPNRQILSDYLAHLHQMKIRYIIVHDNCLSPAQRARIHPFLENFMGKPADGSMGLKLYRVPASTK